MRPQFGFAFALSRLLARLSGRKVCRAQWSGLEAYGVCLLVFGISCVSAGRVLPLVVRPGILRVALFAALPVILWGGFLLLYYVLSLVIHLFRRLGLYSAATNAPLQQLFFASLTTILSFFLLRSGSGWLQSLGILWLGLLALNLISIVVERLFDPA
jgi:Predicted nucleoside-diphosphate sugar epimerases